MINVEKLRVIYNYVDYIKIQNYLFEYIFKKVLSKESSKGYTVLKSIEDIKEWQKPFSDYFEHMDNVLNTNLFNKKGEVTKERISAYEDYSGYGFKRINSYLRNIPCRMHLPTVLKNIGYLEEEFTKFKTEENLIVVRIIDKAKFSKKLKKKTCFIDEGFLSTSIDVNYRKDEDSKDILLNNQILFIIKIPKKTPIVGFPKKISDRGENEVLLNKNTPLFIERKYFIGNITLIVANLKDKKE